MAYGNGSEIQLDLVLETIDGGKQKERIDGISDLKTFFDRSTKASNLAALSDKSYLKIFQILFKTVITEKQAYTKASKTLLKKATAQLSACAEVLRLVVEVGAPKLKTKTIEALVEHHTQALLQVDGTFCPPMTKDYLRSLSTLFAHPNHVEHLKEGVWIDVIDFCLEGIDQYFDIGDSLSSSSTPVHSGPSSRHRSGSRIYPSLNQTTNDARNSSLTRQNIQDLLHIAHCLVSTPNAPLAERYSVIINATIQILQLQGSSIGQLNQLALAVINAVLRYTRTEYIYFSQSVARKIIPIICSFFEGRAAVKDEMVNSVRDEILILIFLIHPHLERVLRDDSSCEFLLVLKELVDVMRAEYSKRTERDQLQLRDIEMTDLSHLGSNPFHLNCFQLRSYTVRAERNWATLQAISILERLISLTPCSIELSDDNTTAHPAKRQRISRTPDRLTEPIRSEDEKSRLAGLQAVPFVVQNLNLSSIDLSYLLAQLLICADDKRGNVGAWALLAIASCTFQTAASQIGSLEWIKSWRTGVRSLTFLSNCRTAAAMLHALLAKRLVLYQDVGEDADAIVTTADINGPVVLCDSSLYLMAHLLNSRVLEVPGANLIASQNAIRWLFSLWKPVDKHFAAHHAIHVAPHNILLLLRTCLGLDRLPISTTTTPCGAVAQVWQSYLDDQEMSCPSCPKFANSESITFVSNTSEFRVCLKIILEILSSKCSGALQDWEVYVADRSAHISAEMYRSALCICVVTLLLLCNSAVVSNQLQLLTTRINEFCQKLISVLSHLEHKDPRDFKIFIEIMLHTVQPYLPIFDSRSFFHLRENFPYLLNFLVMIANQTKKNSIAMQAEVSPDTDIDMTDLEDDFFSHQQDQFRIPGQTSTLMPRHHLALSRWSDSFQLVIAGRLNWIKSMTSSPELTGVLPTGFVDYLLSLNDQDFVSSHQLLHEALVSDLFVDEADADRLVKRLGKILSAGMLDRCEVMLLLCIDVLAALEPLWSGSDENEVAESVSQIYQWLITKVLSKGLCSPEVQKGIAKLLLRLLRSRYPDYGINLLIPSARSSLFDILQRSIVTVKFCIARELPRLFELYVLKDHDTVFVDILGNLPSDADWIEGIAYRLFVLAKLGSTWPTLLRRCIYHIFETPGRVPSSLQHATRCLEQISSKLQVTNAQELFTLFAPQLLYTWLEREDIEDIPFQIFGFNTLQDLVSLAQEEATALMVMRGQEWSIERLALILKVEKKYLLQQSFTKVIAYAIAHDLSTLLSPNEARAEARIKSHLGNELFLKLINLHFADVVAVFFNCIDQDSTAEKYFLKKAELKYAAKIFQQIKGFSSSDIVLPSSQQPLFKVKYLAAEIQHLCSRTRFQMANLYSPAMVTYLARYLLNNIHAALGSLHACAILRKLRVLISLAGQSAASGYPLEMLLQSIRPFLQDPECADDAIGIMQYLIQAGSIHLLQTPNFFAGLSLAILGSTRRFLDYTKSNTAQESQHRNSKTNAEEFRSWIGQYLLDYISRLPKSADLKAKLKLLFESALQAQSVGNADTDTPESKLLKLLLEDERLEKSLLSRPSRELAISMQSANFRNPNSFRSDALGNDKDAIRYAPAVWKSCRVTPSKQYQAWAARILGRAFAASGHVNEELLHESNMASIRELTASEGGEGSSVVAVLSLLRELTLSHDPHIVGVTETALRQIMATADETIRETCNEILPKSLFSASTWYPYQLPPSDLRSPSKVELDLHQLLAQEAALKDDWLYKFSLALAKSVPKDPVLVALIPILFKVPGFADRAFPFILHMILSMSCREKRVDKMDLSSAFVGCLGTHEHVNKHNQKMLLNSILYLRTQALPGERSPAERANWLSIDYRMAAIAANSCGMFKTALLFLEELHSQPLKSSRRSSSFRELIEPLESCAEILLKIYENIDDPDSYYGVPQSSDLTAVLHRFEYEKDGLKSLAFRGAQYDSHIRTRDPGTTHDVPSLVKTLDDLNLSGISRSLLQSQQMAGKPQASIESLFRTARKLEQWDIPVPSSCNNNSTALFKAFQSIYKALDRHTVMSAINEGLEKTMRFLIKGELNAIKLHETLQTLAAFVEMDEVFGSSGSEEFEVVFRRFQERSQWMKVGRFDDISQILSCRATTLSTLSQQHQLQDIIQIKPLDSRFVEVQTALLSSTINRAHSVLQESLSLATSMINLIKPCHSVGVKPEVAIHLEAANALWDHGEMSSSIGMLQALDDTTLLSKQTIFVGRSDLLVRIARQVSDARLEKADKIIDKYLRPALKELKSNKEGSEAGEVFHQFAVFCDQQLHDQGSLEDLERLKKLSQDKSQEVKYYDRLIANSKSSTERGRYRGYQEKAKKWLKLDEEELRRQIDTRREFLTQCLENYLLALGASDDHNSNALRFSALWLEHSEEDLANKAVARHLSKVASMKFAPLMNQLTSRLQDNSTKFQELLLALILRICTDHPYHGMYQIYAGANSIANEKDESAVLRKSATIKLGVALLGVKNTDRIWGAIQTTSQAYCIFAGEKDDRYRSGRRLPLKDSAAGSKLTTALIKYRLPPPTIQIPLVPSCDYSKVPLIISLQPDMQIASGNSAPKIIVAIADNGTRFKQLVKGGNDDLRQDAIMEQVFEQVNELLKTNRSTRQRNLSIRTYRVLPLTNIAGIIEFVPSTIPLHDYLMPAHEKYYPNDIKPSQCRAEIHEAREKGIEARIKAFRNVTACFHPVMRFFFMEKFYDPDEWFARRLAYTRSTAAISILGHVLGLGDRHVHNILMDQHSGEVVHIDLGIAFETGRILPVPELVPFRLTRDITDGMGITKTEGVFRRCCEFTLEALRKEVYTIMSILDVLRYDPLYSWSVSPIRLAKLQQEQSALEVTHVGRAKTSINEPGEADRALTIVNKKLSKTLSVNATVNDLINQASDEKNLAVIFAGWAAYA